jgi:predicted RNA binding protein YcfA (HicA-like mRNA interferase family)
MPKTYKPKEVLQKFKKLGFIEDRQRGSHKILASSHSS